jgi:hypothetical protein
MTNKKTTKKTNLPKIDLKNKKNNYKPLLIIIAISLTIALLSPYIKDRETYIDNNIALNLLEKKYSE